MRFLFYLIGLSVYQCASGVNVLYLSNIPSPSHFIWCKSLLTELHGKGYNITALSADVEESKENFTYHHLENVYPTVYSESSGSEVFLEMGQDSYIGQYISFATFIDDACVGTFNSKGYQQILDYPEDFKFDLIIYDFTMSRCLLGIVHKFKDTPMVSVTPFLISGRAVQLSGSLIFPGFVPSVEDALPQEMNFQERLRSTFIQIFEIGFEHFYFMPMMNRHVQKRHPGIPYIDDIEKETTKIILINSQPITDNKQPVLPNVKLVGGAQIRNPKPLPKGLEEIANNATGGLVLFSLGTNVRSDALGDKRITKIINALRRLHNYTFLWKFETEGKLPIKLPKNIVIQSWMPQNDILAHLNTKLFISHCGLLSSQEAFWYGVPVLCFPIFADQPHNAFRLKEKGVSETLSIFDFSEDELYETTKKLLEDPNYKTKGKAISAALRDQPMTPLEEAVYWTEWVIRHPDINLASPSSKISFVVRHSLDVIALIFFAIVLAVILSLKFIALMIRLCSSTKKVDTVDKKKKIN